MWLSLVYKQTLVPYMRLLLHLPQMASAFRTLFTAASRLTAAAPRSGVSVATQNSKLATIAPGRIIFRSKHIDYTQKYADKLKRKAQEYVSL